MRHYLILALCLINFSTLAATTVERLQRPFVMRDQGNTNTCWLHSGLQMMEQMAETPLSIDALLIPEIRSRALDRFLGHATPWDGGAGPTRPFALALEHGLVPESLWKSKLPLIEYYNAIFRDLDAVLRQFKNDGNQSVFEFLRAIDATLLRYTGTLPPKKFLWNDRLFTSTKFARATIGRGTSVGHDFRNVEYSEARNGKMPEIAWTTIISRTGELKRITSIIGKQTLRTNALEAFEKAAEIFSSGRPVAFTFISHNQSGKKVYGVNTKTEYESLLPPTKKTYTESHLVLITGIIREAGRIVGFSVLDPLSGVERFVTWHFFTSHGKTIHEIRCDNLLSQN